MRSLSTKSEHIIASQIDFVELQSSFWSGDSGNILEACLIELKKKI
jgi:hypothetical protein